MSEKRESIHGMWSSRWAFILAATGSAVGLGNVWKFPYITGINGGGAFVLIYLVCIAVVGLPIMMSEILIGRRGRQSPINALRSLSLESGASPAWQLVGYIGVLAGFVILSFYSVIAGWALAYIPRAATGTFTAVSADAIGSLFGGLLGDAMQLTLWHTVFMLLTVYVVARGVRNGLERAVSVLMPTLFALLILLVGYAMAAGDFAAGLAFLFKPDFSALSPEGILVAMGHAFFTLSLGMGAIMVYGAYLPSNASIAGTSITIACADTAVALLAGLAIFPLVFANGLEPGAGPGLIFQTLPIAFGNMPGGALFGTLFFVLLAFAAWTSAISLLEPVVAWFVERLRVSRLAASLGCGALIWLLGLGSVLSFNHWSEFKLFGKTFFDNLDFLASNIMLPLGGLLIALFAAWIMPRANSQNELALTSAGAYDLWWILARFLTPIAVVLVFLHAIGLIG